MHWSGSDKRLARQFGKRFGDRAYAAEELVAELGAAFLCARIGIEGQLLNRASCIWLLWIELLKDDPRAIFTAASKASQAADFLSSFSEADQSDGYRRGRMILAHSARALMRGRFSGGAASPIEATPTS